MPRPVLSETTFNSDNIATSILQQANLQISNSDLGVTDITNSFVRASNWNAWLGDKCFIFNGFVFLNLSSYISSTHLGSSQHVTAWNINNSDYYPGYDANLITSSYQGDQSLSIKVTTGGAISVEYPHNVGGDTNFHVVINGWYRI